MELLNRLKTPKDIRDALDNLPRTLFETYDRMLEYLEEESSIELASKAFHWVVHSGRPLTLEEVVEALALDENEKRLDLNVTFADPRDLLRVSSSLLYEADSVEEDSEEQDSEEEDSEMEDSVEEDSEEQDSEEEDSEMEDSEVEDSKEGSGVEDLGAEDSVEVSQKYIRFCHYTVQVCITTYQFGKTI